MHNTLGTWLLKTVHIVEFDKFLVESGLGAVCIHFSSITENVRTKCWRNFLQHGKMIY